MKRLCLIDRILFADLLSNEAKTKFDNAHSDRLKKGIDWRVVDEGEFLKDDEWFEELIKNSPAVTPEEKFGDERILLLMRDLRDIHRLRQKDPCDG